MDIHIDHDRLSYLMSAPQFADAEQQIVVAGVQTAPGRLDGQHWSGGGVTVSERLGFCL